MKATQEKDKIAEGNRLIAEFMGNIRRRSFHADGGRWKHWRIEPFGFFDDEDLQYHTSWDWLMPVVQKIESLGDYRVLIGSGNWCHIFKIERVKENITISINSLGMDVTLIHTVYISVVAFITWYNETLPCNPKK